jgi:hypothetical protein
MCVSRPRGARLMTHDSAGRPDASARRSLVATRPIASVALAPNRPSPARSIRGRRIRRPPAERPAPSPARRHTRREGRGARSAWSRLSMSSLMPPSRGGPRPRISGLHGQLVRSDEGQDRAPRRALCRRHVSRCSHGREAPADPAAGPARRGRPQGRDPSDPMAGASPATVALRHRGAGDDMSHLKIFKKIDHTHTHASTIPAGFPFRGVNRWH